MEIPDGLVRAIVLLKVCIYLQRCGLDFGKSFRFSILRMALNVHKKVNPSLFVRFVTPF
jgi:hypothetical protein